MKIKLHKLALVNLGVYLFHLGIVLPANAQTPWPMLGANPQRTGWTPTEVTGRLEFRWVKPFEPYVPITAQATSADGKLFVPTSKGLYALDVDTGNVVWIFSTELPLANSPTYHGGNLYFGGLDRRIYSINATTMAVNWTHTADAGFSTNPLVVNNIVYIGSRGGTFYAVNTSGQELWTKNIGSQILQSAAYSTSNNQLYFGAMDGNAYALDAGTGDIKWKAKLPGMGWTNFWPVVYQDQVIFTRTEYERNTSISNYNIIDEVDYAATSGISEKVINDQQQYLFPAPQDSTYDNYPAALVGTQNGLWPEGTPTVDLSKNPFKPNNSVINFLEDFRDSRNMFFLRQSNGSEIVFDLDNDGKPDAAPFLRTIEDNKTTAPPVIMGCIGCENIIYSRNPIFQSGTFSSSMAIGWKYGTRYASLPVSYQPGLSPGWEEDEFFAYSGGGTHLYWNKQEGKNSGGVNMAVPNSVFLNFVPNFPSPPPAGWQIADGSRQWRYLSSNDYVLPPGTDDEQTKYYWQPPSQVQNNKLLFFDHTTNAPTIYDNKVFIISRGIVAAFGSTRSDTVLKSPAANPSGTSASATTFTATELQSKLAQEINKLVSKDSNGNYIHYKPMYSHFGRLDSYMGDIFGDNLFDYWSNPADTFTILIRALPHLNSSLQTEVKNYLQEEYQNYAPASTAHIGWKDGAFRQPFDWPSTFMTRIQTYPKKASSSFSYWGLPPQNIYATWKFVEAGLCNSPCTANSEFTKIENQLPSTFPHDIPTLNASMPHILNAYIAGYQGFVELAKLANGGSLPSAYQSYQTTLNNLLAARKNQFSTVLTANFGTCPGCQEQNRYFWVLHMAYNFMYLTPELGEYLHSNVPTAMQLAMSIYTGTASSPPDGTNDGPRSPYWMQSHSPEVQGEDGMEPYQQTHALFQAKARILKESQAELSKYLDSPIVPVGDLYYIDNLVAALDASTNPPPPTSPATPTAPPLPTFTPVPGDANGDKSVDILDYSLVIYQFGRDCEPPASCSANFNGDYAVDIFDYSILISNFGNSSPTPTPTLLPTATPTPLPSVTPRG